MKKYILFAMLAFTLQKGIAQDLNKVQMSYLINKIEDAKLALDKVMADPKLQAKTETIYWKSKVFASIYKDSTLRKKYPTAVKDADDAFKKYTSADPAYAVVKEKGAEGFFDMYGTAYALGVKVFNDKKWEEAIANFSIAVEYSDIIFKNKWTSSNIPFDTTSILFLGYSYQNANKAAEAVKQYTRLADSKVGGESNLDMYKFTANHFTVTKNEADFIKYIAIGKEVYPKEDKLWEEFEIDYMDKNLTLKQKIDLYDKEDAAGTLSEVKYLQFGDIFVTADHKEKGIDSLQKIKYNLKAAEAFQKAFAKNNQNGIAAFNVGVIYYNIYGEYDDRYAANIRTMQGLNSDRPVEKDPKKKAAADAKLKESIDPIKKANADIEKPLMDNLDLSLQWLEKSYLIMKNKSNRDKTEKSVINKSVDFIANLFAYKRDRVRGKDSKAFDVFDAKFKEFDGLHGKF